MDWKNSEKNQMKESVFGNALRMWQKNACRRGVFLEKL